MMSFIPMIMAIIAFVISGLYLYFKYWIYNFWRKRNVFYIEPTIPVGNIMPLVNNKASIQDFFIAMYNQYKHHPYLGIFTFHRPNLIINDPDVIREVLAKEFASFHDRGLFCNEEIDPLSGHLFLLPGKKWRHLRVKLTPTFTSGKIKQIFLILKETSDVLSTYLKSKAEAKATIEVKDILARFSTDIIMSTAFGVTCNSLENPDNEFRRMGKKAFEPKPIRNSLLLFAPKVFDFLSVPYTEKTVTNFFMNVFKDMVNYRELNNVERKDFLDLLMQLMKNGYVEPDEIRDGTDDQKCVDTTKLTISEASAQAYVFFLAGFETSATTTSFCFYELAFHQDVQDKVRKEILTIIQKHGELTYNAVCEMSYLQKTISETMRKYPPVAVLNRITTKEVQLPSSKVVLPEGVSVSIPVIGLHRDPSIYPDPEKFDPERFSPENIAARHPYVYLPFGEGPRICIGLRFGLMQVKIAIISVLSKYRLKPAPDTPKSIVYEKGSLVTAAVGGLPLTIELL